MDSLSDKFASANLGASAKTVHLPLSKLERCDKCGATDEKLFKLCSSCGERVYCSAACQTADWDLHKKTCGNKKNDPIDLGRFYPVLAVLAEACHPHNAKPTHPALDYQIINDVNPSSHPVDLPDGLGASKLLVLGEKKGIRGMDILHSKGWFPQAQSLKVQGKLFRRVVREGYALPIALALCMSLMMEIYTTDYDPTSGARRCRLRYKSSPIADFGIANGEVDVKSQDKLAYWFPDGTIMTGQDPKDHYWIYFTTAKGEEITLDVSMFTFNMCLCVRSAPYVDSMSTLKGYGVVPSISPAFFRDRLFEQRSPRLYKERRRVSVLRNTSLHGAIANLADGDPDAGYVAADPMAIIEFLAAFARPTSGPLSSKEQELTLIWTFMMSQHLGECLASGKWKTFPEEVPTAIEQDPNELRNLDEEAAEWDRWVTKWRRKYKKAKAKAASEKQD